MSLLTSDLTPFLKSDHFDYLEPPHNNDFCQHATKSLGLCQTSDFAPAESLRFSCD